VGKVIWFYDKYCSRFPKLTEACLILVAIVIVHFGLAYVRDAAAKKALQTPQIQPSSNATTTGPMSPATAGNGNSVTYETPKDDGKAPRKDK
jgi:hypothetical protein